MMAQPVLIVSGGAESVSIAIAEWAVASRSEVLVFALVPSSLLESVPGVKHVSYARSSVRDDVLADLEAFIFQIRGAADAPVLAFPTEDDSFGLLVELSGRLGDRVLSCSRCRALQSGGLDKAELFSYLGSVGLGSVIADTMTVMNEADVAVARAEFGEDVVLKPASKPWATNLSGGAKTHSGTELETEGARSERQRDFAAGRRWVAQKRLGPLNGGERSACVVRDNRGVVRYAEVVEWMKYPARGGSACIVETQPGEHGLRQAALAILAAVDAVGIVELSFLADASGKPRLLELNARPWLQIDLLQSAGFDVLGDAAKALEGGGVSAEVELRPAVWISLERVLLKLLSGDGGSRRQTLGAALRALYRMPRISTWSSRLPGVRLAWLVRNVKRFVR